MLRLPITVKMEGFDSTKNKFIPAEKKLVCFEHSLISISEWESEWEKSFFETIGKAQDLELIDSYIKCMMLDNRDISLLYMTIEERKQILNYISSKQSATTVTLPVQNNSKHTILTSELIYYYLVNYKIPFEVASWNFNRMWNLIMICQLKSGPEQKMTPAEARQHVATVNAQRRAAAQK